MREGGRRAHTLAALLLALLLLRVHSCTKAETPHRCKIAILPLEEVGLERCDAGSR